MPDAAAAMLGALVGLALLMATGCAAAPAPSPAATANPTDWGIEYRREGGFAGFMDRLVINGKGECNLTRKQKASSCTPAPALLQDLQTRLDRAQFFALAGTTATPPCCDHISYFLRYRVGSREHSINFYDTSVPSALQETVSALDKFIASASTP